MVSYAGPVTEVSGIGSWSGVDAFAAVDAVAQVVASVDESAAGVRGLPYLPELPARGPGADMIGRSASLLADLAVDLQPSGWRLVDRPGVDQGRATSFLRQDRDALAETFDGWTGPLKMSYVGPWTMAAGLRLGRGERVLSDEGAARDVAQALAEGIAAEVRHITALLPGAVPVVQLDEPSLPAVLAGSISSSSGYRRHRPVGEDEAAMRMSEVIDTLRSRCGAERVVVHCCATDVPVGLLSHAGADAVSLDVSLLRTAGWEACAALLEEGRGLWAGLPVPLAGALPAAADLVRPVVRALETLALSDEVLGRVTLTPACGLAGAASHTHAAASQGLIVTAAKVLREQLLG